MKSAINVIAALACAGAVALPAAGEMNGLADPAVSRLLKGFNDVTSFTTNTSLTGYSGVEPRSGQRITLYYDAKAKVVIYGVGFDLGANKQLGPPIALKGRILDAPSSSAQDLNGAEKQKVIQVVGKMAYVEVVGANADGRVLYAVVEPNCGYCRTSYRDLMPQLADKTSPLSRLTVRWIPVSLNPANFPQVALALDPATGTSLDRANAIFSKVPGKVATGSANRMATTNLGAFQSVNFEGTPTFVLVKGQTEKVTVGYGGIEEFKAWLN